jgi:putative ABC transport system substrate-binding protein
MRRRDFIALLSCAATATAFTARAQQNQQMRRIGMLVNGPETDALMMARVAAFKKTLNELGWTPDKSRIDVRYGVDNDELREKAKELVDLTPDVVLAMAPPSVFALRKFSRTVPVVFAAVTDPVGLGIVQDLAHPGGNATGFLTAEFGFGAKWLELLKEISPNIRRVLVVTDLDNASSAAQFAAIQSVSPSIGVDVRPLGLSDDASIEHAIADLARSGNGGIIALRLSEVIARRQLIAKLAAQYRLPAIYPLRIFAADGGLIAYGPDTVDQFRRAASYVDRILKGEKPADLPVQAPTKYELVINLKTAKELGLTIPPAVLARADAVIE